MTSFNLGAALQQHKEQNEITVLETGTYTLEVTAASSKQAAKGPTITPIFKVVSGPHAGKRAMAGVLSFSEAALWKTIPLIKGFGISDDFLNQAAAAADPIKEIANALPGRVVEAQVSIRPWQGEDRNQLDRVSLTGGAASVPPAPPVVAAPPAAAPAPVAATPAPAPAAPVAVAAPAPVAAPVAAPPAPVAAPAPAAADVTQPVPAPAF